MIEGFVLLGIGLTAICFRMYLRIVALGWRGLRLDDYLMALAGVVYCGLLAAEYISLVQCKGLSNDGMTDEHREMLDPGSDEYAHRVRGAKVELVGRLIYVTALWLTKGSMLAFCRRLTERFGKYETRIRIGFFFLGATWLADLFITLLSCRPFYMNWQINPNPGEICYPATSAYSLFGTLSFNIFTSLYVFFVPLPVLWMANIDLWKKLGLILLVSANCFVIAVAILRGYLILANLSSGASLASRWGYRVTFVAVVATNLPLFFPLIWRLVALVVKVKPNIRNIRTITTFSHVKLVTGRVPQEGHNDDGNSPMRNENTHRDSVNSHTGDHLGVDIESAPDAEGRDRRNTMISIQDRLAPQMEESF